jgi:hypothetical protein
MLQQELNTEQLLFQLIGACRPVVGETEGAWAGEIDRCWHRLVALGQRMVRERLRPQGLQDRAPLKAHLGGGRFQILEMGELLRPHYLPDHAPQNALGKSSGTEALLGYHPSPILMTAPNH